MSLVSNGRYILRGHEPVPCEDLLTWATWLEDQDNTRVAFTEFPGCLTKLCTIPGPRFGMRQTAYVSTVFLGLDQRGPFREEGSGPPILFETMIFWDGPLDTDGARYATWEEAERGHEEFVWRVRIALGASDPLGGMN